MVKVTQADRELFITLSNADGQIAERILCGQAFTWEVEQIARHRLAERDAVVKWLLSDAARLDYEASGSEEHFSWWAADQIKAGEPFK